jgi:AraC-like DNA-binding protein
LPDDRVVITRFRLSRLTAVRLQERSISPDAVMRGAGLPPALLQEEKCLLTTEQLFAFWRAIADVSGDPLIGLALGSEDRLERLDLAQLAALSASSLRDALERAARYKQLSCPEDIRLDVGGAESIVTFHWLLAEGLEPWVLTDVCFGWIATLAARGTGGVVRPTRVELKRTAPGIQDQYGLHFGCPVRFGRRANALVFRTADLDRPFVTHNADLLSILAPSLDAELIDRDTSHDARDQVKAVLRRLLAGRRPDLADVARELASTPRTLQRRLRELGVTFHQVREEARRAMASQYLLHSSLELSEVAYLLGYEDANSFFRAFTRWEGVSPGRWRDAKREHRVDASPMYHGRDRTTRSRAVSSNP